MLNITDDMIVDAAVKYYRKTGFPYPQLEKFEILQTVRDLQNKKFIVKKDRPTLFIDAPAKSVTTSGAINDQQIVNFFHPHIWESKAVNRRSPVESFRYLKSIKKALFLSKKHGGEYTKKLFLHYMRVVNGTQMCSNFRPVAAKGVYDYLGGKDTLDMSSGYGGRLLGFLTSNMKGVYTGVDPNKLTCECNVKMAKFFGVSKRVKIIHKPFEDCTRLPKVDVAFTSPPYFNKEVYDPGSKTQSSHRYETYEKWRDDFLGVMIKKATKALRPKGVLVINIADVKTKGITYPLVRDTVDHARNNGFALKETLHLWMPHFSSAKKAIRWSEPILIFRSGV